MAVPDVTGVKQHVIPAATVLVVRERNGMEVLMAQRSDRGMFANALVFPGGVLEDDDRSGEWLPHLTNHEELPDLERALRIAGLREVWEETGLSVCTTGPDLGLPPQSVSADVFRGLVKKNRSKLALDELIPFSN